jgi:hypothetical protein
MTTELERYYDARINDDLRRELEAEGYLVRYNDNDDLELIEFGGGYRRLNAYWERPTGEIFDSVQAAHRYVFVNE